jgi:penicillin-binding protein 1A
MALGAVEVSPMEMAQAYAPFSNGGYLARAYAIERIRTADGRVLYDHGVDRPPRQSVIAQPALAYMVTMMRGVVQGGTGGRANVPGYDIAGKTGTTSDYRDAWFVGYTGGFVTVVWLGKDDNTPMRRVTGGAAPAEIWKAYMTAALPRLKVEPIPGGEVPEEYRQSPIDRLLDGVTGLFQGAGDAEAAPAGDHVLPAPRPRRADDPPF